MKVLRSSTITALRIAVLFAVLYLLARHVSQNRADYAFVLVLEWRFALPIVLLSMLNLLLESVRYSATAHEMGRRIPLFNGFVYLVVARFLDKLVPQSGIAYKAHVIRKGAGLGSGEMLAGFGSLVWLQLLVTFLIACTVVGFLRPGLQIGGIQIIWLLAGAPVMLLLVTLAIARFVTAVEPDSSSGGRPWYRFRAKLARHVRVLLQLIRSPMLLTISVLTIAAATLVSVARLYFCFKMVGVDTDAAVLTLFVTMNRAMTVFPLTPGNLGITEFLFGVLARDLGMGMAQGVAAAFLLRLIMFAVLSLLGLLFLLVARQTIYGENKAADPTSSRHRDAG